MNFWPGLPNPTNSHGSEGTAEEEVVPKHLAWQLLAPINRLSISLLIQSSEEQGRMK